MQFKDTFVSVTDIELKLDLCSHLFVENTLLQSLGHFGLARFEEAKPLVVKKNS